MGCPIQYRRFELDDAGEDAAPQHQVSECFAPALD